MKLKSDRLLNRIIRIICRFLPIIQSLYISIQLYYAYNGEFLIEYNYDLGLSFWLNLLLLLCILKQGKYHCIYNISLAINLLIIAALGSIQLHFYCIEKDIYFKIVVTTTILATIIFIFLSIKHFYNVLKNAYNSIS